MKRNLASLFILIFIVIFLTGCGTVKVQPNSTGTNPKSTGKNKALPVTPAELEKNITSKGEITELGKLVVIVNNNNSVAVDMEIEVEFYDANNTIVGSDSEDLMAVGANKEIAIDFWSTPDSFDNYKIFVDVEKSDEKDYSDKLSVSHNNTGEQIAVQATNNSEDTIEYITVGVVFYKEGNVIGYDDSIESDIKPGRSANFNIDYPYDKRYKNIPFDDYKVFINEAYSYNW